MNDDFNSKAQDILQGLYHRANTHGLNHKYDDDVEQYVDFIISLIKSDEERARESERDHIFSVIRSLGYKIDRSAVIKLHREWDTTAKEAEARRAILDGGKN